MTDLPSAHDGLLNWPLELAGTAVANELWYTSPSNLCLDFHGDPARAELVVFSDGNHHMALQESLQKFQQVHKDLSGVFYMTTPPAVVRMMLEQGGVYLGNLHINATPHIIIGPDTFLNQIKNIFPLAKIQPFMKSRGCALIVPKGNPRNISGIHDLLRDDIRIACSNPQTETASYQVYRGTVINHVGSGGSNDRPGDFFSLGDKRMVFSQRIHHREVPALIAGGKADVALVYYHLALRYVRIFPEQIQMLPLDQEDANDKDVITDYHVALADDSGSFGKACFNFLAGPEVHDVYQRHGLVASGE